MIHPSSTKVSKQVIDIAFIGGLFRTGREQKILTMARGAAQSAANALQWEIVRGLDEQNLQPTQLINAAFVGSYPKWHRELVIHGTRWQHVPGSVDCDVGFLNLFGIKHLHRAAALTAPVVRFAKQPSPHQKALVIYSIHMPFLWAMACAKHVNPSLLTCLVVPDLPEFMNISGQTELSYRILKICDQWLIDKLLNYVDSFVVLTEAMAKRLKVGSRPFIVMEGIAHLEDHEPPQVVSNQPSTMLRTIFYSGTLAWQYGIGNLIASMASIPGDTLRLQICGAGQAQEAILKAAQKDPRIQFLGLLPHHEVLVKQRQATLLVNPRTNEGEYTRYSFPSKTMEYLGSGRPLVAYKLDGIPSEYDAYIHYVKGNTPEALAGAITELLSLSEVELTQRGEAARSFVMAHKNRNVQANRILALLGDHKSTPYKIRHLVDTQRNPSLSFWLRSLF